MPDVIFNGPEGRLEGRYQHAKKDDAPVALILHPHPQHGGTMNNKVVYSLYHSELSDAASALDWMQSHNPNASGCWIAGFSFGAWIAMQLMMRRPEINGFIAIAPPASIHDFTFLAPCPASGMLVHGDADDIIPEESVAKLADKLGKQKNITIDYNVIKGCDHFFRDHLDPMEKHVEKYLNENL